MASWSAVHKIALQEKADREYIQAVYNSIHLSQRDFKKKAARIHASLKELA